MNNLCKINYWGEIPASAQYVSYSQDRSDQYLLYHIKTSVIPGSYSEIIKDRIISSEVLPFSVDNIPSFGY
jgi:hypothetical protein